MTFLVLPKPLRQDCCYSRTMARGLLNAQKSLFLIALAGVLIYGNSLRPSVKYLDSLVPGVAFIGLMTIALVALSYFLSRAWFRRVLMSPVSWLSVLGILGLLTLFFYPLADGLKDHMGGWDQDDCLKLGIENLLQGQNPYSDKTYFGNPCSPGFGAFVIYLPFVAAGVFSLAPIIWLGLSHFVVTLWVQNKIQASLFFFVIASSPMTLELLVNGSDIVIMGLGLVLSALGVQFALRRGGLAVLGMAAVLVGLVASMRVNFLLLVAVATVFVFVKTRFGGGLFRTGCICSVNSAEHPYLPFRPCGLHPPSSSRKIPGHCSTGPLRCHGPSNPGLAFYRSFARHAK